MDNGQLISKQLIILHIPKTAGTSLRKIVEMNYEPHECYYIYDNSSPFNTMSDYKQLSIEQRKQYKIVMGHFPYSPHVVDGLDSASITIMRDPVERVISYYHHVIERNKHNGTSNQSMSLLKYITESGDNQLSNFQTKLIAGAGWEGVTDEHLDGAYYNIENKFTYVGLSEQFEKAIEFMSRKCSWEYDKNIRENISINRHPVTYYSDYEIEKIIDANRYDIELYNHVKKSLINSNQ